jgi:pilus assembly protein CpaC
MMGLQRYRRAALLAAAVPALIAGVPAAAQVSVASGVDAGQLDVPVNKSQVLRADRPYAKALIGNPDIADIVPISPTSVYVLGKKTGTTSLTLYDRSAHLIAVVDVVVGPDVMTLKRQLADLLPGDVIAARMSNDSVILEGMVHDAVAADRAVQIAETYAPGKVVNLLSLGSAQQVMLEVRFAEVNRSALSQIGVNWGTKNTGDTRYAIGGGASVTPIGGTSTINIPGGTTTVPNNTPVFSIGSITDSFGIIAQTFRAFGSTFNVQLDALERKGAVTTLAQPTLIALSGETASFLAGGEFPVPTVQNVGSGGTSAAYTVQWKPFGVSLAFTPTVLADGVINLIVAPEVSSIDPSASIVINGLSIPGIQTRRAKTVVELRDGESFALAGLIRKDFQDTVRQVPLLGSLPIIGALFRSTGFQHQQTELVIIVTPRLVRPVPAGALKVPTDRVQPPNEADLLINGRTDTGVPQIGRAFVQPPPPPPPPPPAGGPVGGMAQNTKLQLEKDYGHVL